MGKLFGTDGVRGQANTELTPELAFDLGRAGAYVLTKETRHAPGVIIGMDTRISGNMLECALAAGMCSIGARVHLAGVIPTPGVAALVRSYGLDAGVMISASHNPYPDNGIKFFNADGYKLADALEDEIEAIIASGLSGLPRPAGEGVGQSLKRADALADYTDFLTSTLGGRRLDGLRVVMDCANGASYCAAPEAFRRLGAQVTVLNDAPDGININAGCGSTHIEGLAAYMRGQAYDIGMAFDGDGDRCLFVDECGDIIDGDQVLSILANHMRAEGRLPGDVLVATVMSNLGLFLMGERLGIGVEKTAVGDRYVLERMLTGGYALGGEQSGHIIMTEFNTTGDGIVTALQISDIIKRTGKGLSALNVYMRRLPQALANAAVSNERKHRYAENAVIADAIAALDAKYAGSGRVLIRASGTEPLVRVMLEGEDIAELERDAKQLAALLERELV